MAALFALPIAGVLLALAGFAGAGAVGVLILTAILLLAASVSGAFGVREGRGPATSVAAVGVVAVTLALVEPERSDGRPDLVDVVVPVLAVVFLCGALAQLGRRGGRSDVVTSMAITIGCSAMAVVGVMWIPLSYTPIGDLGAVVAGFAIAASGAVLLIGPWWVTTGRPVDIVIAAAVMVGPLGGLLALLLVDTGSLTWVQAVVLGGVAAASAVVGRSWVLTAVDERATAKAARPVAADASDPSESSVDTLLPPARMPDPDQALIAATAVAVLIAAGPVYVAARILVG